MSAPVTQNKAIDPQANPGSDFLTQVEVGLAHIKAISHDPSAMGTFNAVMNGQSGWSTQHIDHDGNHNEVTHGAKKQAAQASHRDTSGGHDVCRVAGGTHNQAGNGTNHENGEHETKSVAGAVTTATQSSGKTYSQGGDGHIHHKGDMAFSVEEGGMHYNVAQDFTVTATGKLIHFDSAGDLSFKVKTNETHNVTGNTSFTTSNKTKIISQSDINIISLSSITLSVGDNKIVISQSGIAITGSAISFTKA
jgi:hypothetical protein